MSRPLKVPHFITDSQERVISCASVAEAFAFPKAPLTNGKGEVIGSVRCAKADLSLVQSAYYSETQEFDLTKMAWHQKAEQILARDFESIFFEASQKKCDLDDVLKRACYHLRSYLLAEYVSIFGLPDGHTIQGLFAVFPEGCKGRDAEWNLGSMNLAAHVIQTKKPYICKDPATDPLYEKIQGREPPPNLVCFPIMFGGEIVGLINVSKRICGPFGDEELFALKKYSTLMGHLLREEFESRQNELFQQTSANLGKYLSANVVRNIAQNGTAGELGGKRKHVVVLFSDIRGFTKLSAALTPEQLISLLNDYFEDMSVVIEKYNGTLDKIVGDLMMVVWNIPHDQPDPETLAVKAAIEMQKVVRSKVVPRWLNAGVPGFGIGIGIHAGEAVVGNLGSKRFMNYTVIGPNVNLSNRIESKCKAGEVWVHESIIPKVAGKVPAPARKETGLVLKGIEEPVNVYVFLPNS